MAKVEIKQTSNVKNNLLKLLALAVATYILASIAVDRGLIWYFPTFVAAFFAAKYLVLTIKRR